MVSTEHVSLFILLGIVIFFIALALLPVEIVIEEEPSEEELL